MLKDSSSDGLIKKGDIVLKIDGKNIARNNTLKVKGIGRVSSEYLINNHQIGDIIKINLIRNKKEIIVNMPLKKNMKIVKFEHEKKPKYYIFGGFVFMPLTFNYLKDWGSDKNWRKNTPENLLYLYDNEYKMDTDVKEVVFIANTLANEENTNFFEIGQEISSVNGKKVTSFANLVKTIKESKDEYIKISLPNGESLILNRENALKADPQSLKDYGIGSAESL